MAFLLKVSGFCNSLLLVGLLWIAAPASVQNILRRFEAIGVNEGLSQSSVYSILQDRQGFMWFGTADGLNRYDGDEIRIFKVKSAGAIANSNFIRGRLQESDDGNIWFSNETGIYYFDALGEKIQTAYSFRDNTSAKIFYSIMIEGTDLWLGSSIDGLVRFSMTKKEVEIIPYPVKTDGYHFVADWSTLGNQILFSISGFKGVYRFDVKRIKFELLFESWNGLKIQGDKSKMYLFSSDRIYVSGPPYNRMDTLQLTSSGLKNVRSVLEDNFGRIWINTIGNGLYCRHPKEGNTFVYRHDNSIQKTLPSNIVTTTYADRADNLWIGTDGGGVARLDLKPPKFNLFPLNEGDYPALKDYFTKCFFEDDAGRIWFGTHHIGFVVFDPHT